MTNAAVKSSSPPYTTWHDTALIRTKYCSTKPNIIIVWWGVSDSDIRDSFEVNWPIKPSLIIIVVSPKLRLLLILFEVVHISMKFASSPCLVDPPREEWIRIFLAHAWPRKSSSAVLTFINTTRVSTANKFKLERRNNKSTPTHYKTGQDTEATATAACDYVA